MYRLLIALALCVGIVSSGCVTTWKDNPDGSTSKTYNLDVANAQLILLWATEARDLVTARLAAYEAASAAGNEPSAFEVALAEARAALLRRGIDWLNTRFDELDVDAESIDVPVGLFRRMATDITAETGISIQMSANMRAGSPLGFHVSFGTQPPPLDLVSPNDEPWRFGAAGFPVAG